MNRRIFLKSALIGAGVVAVAPKMLSTISINSKACAPEILGDYVDYSSFSQAAIATSIDEAVQRSAAELRYRAGQSINDLYAVMFDSYQPVAFGRMA